MRCDYCGWLNGEGVERCVKCNQLLVDSVEDHSATASVGAGNEQSLSLNATVTLKSKGECVDSNSSEEVDMLYCSSCGYPLPSGSQVCPACGTEVVDEQPVVSRPVVSATRQTVVDPAGVVAAMAGNAVAAQENINTKATIRDLSKVAASASPEDFKKTVIDVRATQTPATENGGVEAASVAQPVNMKATVRDVSTALKESNATSAMLKKTVRDFSFLEKSENLNVTKCEEVAEEPKTVSAKLIPMENFDGKAKEFAIESDSVVLNRGNVDPDNMFIDEDAQATVSYENGSWYINNMSKSQVVYVSTQHKIEIKTGDIVVIGNRRYIFQ